MTKILMSEKIEGFLIKNREENRKEIKKRR